MSKIKQNIGLSCVILFGLFLLVGWIVGSVKNKDMQTETGQSSLEKRTGRELTGTFKFDNSTFTIHIVNGVQLEAFKQLFVDRFIPINNNQVAIYSDNFSTDVPLLAEVIAKGKTTGPRTRGQGYHFSGRSDCKSKCDMIRSKPWSRYNTMWDTYYDRVTIPILDDLNVLQENVQAMVIQLDLGT